MTCWCGVIIILVIQDEVNWLYSSKTRVYLSKKIKVKNECKRNETSFLSKDVIYVYTFYAS